MWRKNKVKWTVLTANILTSSIAIIAGLQHYYSFQLSFFYERSNCCKKKKRKKIFESDSFGINKDWLLTAIPRCFSCFIVYSCQHCYVASDILFVVLLLLSWAVPECTTKSRPLQKMNTCINDIYYGFVPFWPACTIPRTWPKNNMMKCPLRCPSSSATYCRVPRAGL